MDKTAKKRKVSKLEIGVILAVLAFSLVGAYFYTYAGGGKTMERNDVRTEDVKTISDAFEKYTADNSGGMPSEVPLAEVCDTETTEICKSDADSCEGLVELESLDLVAPVDPSATGNGTGYHIMQNDKGRVTVCAPLSEDDTLIQVVL